MGLQQIKCLSELFSLIMFLTVSYYVNKVIYFLKIF